MSTVLLPSQVIAPLDKMILQSSVAVGERMLGVTTESLSTVGTTSRTGSAEAIPDGPAMEETELGEELEVPAPPRLRRTLGPRAISLIALSVRDHSPDEPVFSSGNISVSRRSLPTTGFPHTNPFALFPNSRRHVSTPCASQDRSGFQQRSSFRRAHLHTSSFRAKRALKVSLPKLLWSYKRRFVLALRNSSFKLYYLKKVHQVFYASWLSLTFKSSVQKRELARKRLQRKLQASALRHPAVLYEVCDMMRSRLRRVELSVGRIKRDLLAFKMELVDEARRAQKLNAYGRIVATSKNALRAFHGQLGEKKDDASSIRCNCDSSHSDDDDLMDLDGAMPPIPVDLY